MSFSRPAKQLDVIMNIAKHVNIFIESQRVYHCQDSETPLLGDHPCEIWCQVLHAIHIFAAIAAIWERQGGVGFRQNSMDRELYVLSREKFERREKRLCFISWTASQVLWTVFVYYSLLYSILA